MKIKIPALLTTLILNSCSLIDRAGDRTEVLITHTSQEIKQLKDELKQDISQLKTESIQELQRAVEETTPKVVEGILNADAVAFLIVAVTILLGLVVISALILIGRLMWRWRC